MDQDGAACLLFIHLNHVEGDAAQGVAGAALCCERARGEAPAEEGREDVRIGAAPVGQSHDAGSFATVWRRLRCTAVSLSGAQKAVWAGQFLLELRMRVSKASVYR